MADSAAEPKGRPVVLVHSSDIHIDEDIRPGHYNGLEGLRYVLRAACALDANVLLLAGDTFDHGHVPEEIARQAADILLDAPMPVVILPGNHDPALSGGILIRAGIPGVPQALVIGHTHPERLLFADLDLEIIGRPHTSYNDMHPLPDIPTRSTRWQVIIAHGHFVPPEDWSENAHRSWLISEKDLQGLDVDYVALGHWDRAESVGGEHVRAYYSGAPDLAQTVNVIRLDPASGVSVERHPLDMPFPPRW
ncbi:MAG: exonuclease SbcCD subunit D [Hyphomicrobiaceae bacterium]